MPEGFRRHDLLDVAPEAWSVLLDARPDLAGVPHLSDWAGRGRPVIVRRRAPGEDSAGVPAGFPVGLPLPPGDGKRRIGLTVPPGAVRLRPAVGLAEAGASAPAAWTATLAALADLGARHGLAPRVFGGLLWQHLTGLTYLSDTSDLDLLWPLAGPLDPRFLDDLAALAAAAPMRLDGEVIAPDGEGLHWAELHAAGPGGSVLAKSIEGVRLRPVAPLLAGAPA